MPREYTFHNRNTPPTLFQVAAVIQPTNNLYVIEPCWLSWCHQGFNCLIIEVTTVHTSVTVPCFICLQGRRLLSFIDCHLELEFAVLYTSYIFNFFRKKYGYAVIRTRSFCPEHAWCTNCGPTSVTKQWSKNS